MIRYETRKRIAYGYQDQPYETSDRWAVCEVPGCGWEDMERGSGGSRDEQRLRDHQRHLVLRRTR